MNDLLAPLFNLLPAMWEKRWWGLAVAWAFALLGAVGVLAYKERYMASATVYVDTQSTLRPLLQGLAVQPDVGQQVTMLARTLLSPATLEAVIERDHLLPAGAGALQRRLLIQRLSTSIEFKINGRDNIYQISYIGTDPRKTLGVVRTLIDVFVHRGVANNERDSSQALRFIDSQIALYKTKLQDIENRLTAFRTAHPEYSVRGPLDYNAMEAQLQGQLITLQGQLTAAVSARDALQGQLGQVHPTLAPSLMPGGVVVAAPSAIDLRIDQLRKHLDDLLQRYTDAYPDVIATRQALARLEAQRQREQQAGPGAAPAQPSYSQATNPVYQQLRISLAQAAANVAALQSQVADVRARLQHLGEQQRKMPGLDEQYAQLNRDYGVISDSYQKLVQRRESAMLSRNQDRSRSQDYFRVVDPPRLGPTALFPRRTFLIALVLVLAVALGVATSYALVMLFPTYRTSRQLREDTQRTVLGSITLVQTPASLSREHSQRRMFLAASALLVIGFVAWALANILYLNH